MERFRKGLCPAVGRTYLIGKVKKKSLAQHELRHLMNPRLSLLLLQQSY